MSEIVQSKETEKIESSPQLNNENASGNSSNYSSNNSSENSNSSGQYKRGIAYKLRINDIFQGKPVLDDTKQRFNFLELGDKKVTRVNVIGNIVDKYENPGEKNYIFFTLDDGSGQIKVRTFGEDSDKFKNINQGQTVVVIGKLRQFNNEIYIIPEIIKEKDSKYLLVRKKEIEKDKSSSIGEVEKSEVSGIKEKLLNLIKSSEDQGGIEIDAITTNAEMSSASPEVINQEIQKLLEQGIVFEPRPGKLRWLG